ncbi:MAG TPA: glycosyltransferase family 2 protein [Planctomycetes bacterium]|nr:glycosyltransferase family 2 protein [Planctomycetota bacterium]
MYKGLKVLFLTCAYNEEGKIETVLERMRTGIEDEILMVDDGSTDATAELGEKAGATVIRLPSCLGVGFALRRGLEYAREQGFDVVVTIAGNNKDNPDEAPALLDPIADDGYDFVMGSRFLAGGGYGGDMPFYRKLATRLHPFLVGLFTGRKITESTNGFRAMRLSVLDDKRIDLYQGWLDHYELEVYLLMKLILLGYKTCEVPATKIYPKKALGRTKMRPFLDWYRILRPVFLIGLRIKK